MEKIIYNNTVKINANFNEAAKIRDKIAELLEKYSYSTKIKMNICLCFEEAISNAIQHGSTSISKEIEISYYVSQNLCIIEVVDFGGFTFNPEYFERIAKIQTWRHGGRGIYLIKNLMDEVYFFFIPNQKTSVVMIKYN